MRHLCAIIATALLAGSAFAGTINVPGDQPTIAAAISASSNGDVINIDAGTYYEWDLNPNGKAITIQGTLNSDGSWATSINAQQNSRVFYIGNGEGPGTIIRNLIVEGGYPSNSEGGGFKIEDSSPTINNCHIHSNTSGNNKGGGIYLESSSPLISDCVIELNSAVNAKGGGIACRIRSFPVISHCKIQNNTSTNNSGGGIYAEFFGQGNGSNSYPSIGHSFVCGNSPDQIDGQWNDSGNNGIAITCNIGGCCLNNGASCTTTTQSDCQNFGGVYLGDVVICSTSTCNDDEDGDGEADSDDNCYLYNPDQADCNENGIGDICDIADGTANDINGNSIPDECECISDIFEDGTVDVLDLLAVINFWGSNGGDADINFDGAVDVIDLLAVIDKWGSCE